MPYTVYKYPIPIDDDFALNLPKDARVLTVQTQKGEPFIWVLINPHATQTPRKFILAGIGHPIHRPDLLKYIGSFQLPQGSLVFHLFEVEDV